MGSGPPFKKIDLSQYTLKIQQVKNNIENQKREEEQKICKLNQQQQTSLQDINNEQNKLQTLFQKKVELQSYLNEQIKKLSIEKQKEYEKEIEELKKLANQLDFEIKLSDPDLPEQQPFNAKQIIENAQNEAKQIKVQFFKAWIQIPRKDLQRELDQFNKVEFQIQAIILEMRTIETNFSQLSKELHINNHILSERRNFYEKMDANLINFENKIKATFYEILSIISEQQAENLKIIQIELNTQQKLCLNKQIELDYQTKKIINLKQRSQELQNQITKCEGEKKFNKNLNDQLQEKIDKSEKQIKQQIEKFDKMKDENTKIVQAIKKLKIEFEEKISRFELESQNQTNIKKNEMNDNIENQIKASLDNNQILDNFQQMMNKSLQILQLQNDRLVSIQSQLEQSQIIIIENQEKIEKKDKEIFDKNKQIENLQNQIEELEQNNSILKKEVAKQKKQQEIKYKIKYVIKNEIKNQPKGFKWFFEIQPLQVQILPWNFSSKIQWIEIFYESENPYTHQLCSTKAKISSNAMVSCNGGCQSFQLKSAVFDLMNSQVYEQINIQKLPKDHVYLGGSYRSLLDYSLQKAGINKEEKKDFLENFRISYQNYSQKSSI